MQLPTYVPRYFSKTEEEYGGIIMRTLGKIATTLGVVGAIALGSPAPAAAWYGYYHRHYYHHYGYYHPYRHYGYYHHYGYYYHPYRRLYGYYPYHRRFWGYY
jgi:hypothetical protein